MPDLGNSLFRFLIPALRQSGGSRNYFDRDLLHPNTDTADPKDYDLGSERGGSTLGPETL